MRCVYRWNAKYSIVKRNDHHQKSIWQERKRKIQPNLALIWRLKLLTCGKWAGCVDAMLMYCSLPDPGADVAFKCTSCGWCCDGDWFCAWAINWFCACDWWCACIMGIFISGWIWICDGNKGGNIFSKIYRIELIVIEWI